MKLKSVGNTILRAVPEGECSLLCADGRFGFGERQSVERKLNAKVNGNAHFVAKDDAEAIDKVRELLMLLPSNAGNEQNPVGPPKY